MKLIFSIFIGLISFNFAYAQELKILNRGNGSEVDSLNIHLAEGLNSQNVLRDLYEGLMTLDSQGKPILGVAEKYLLTNNTYVFSLRKDAKWSDGHALIAADFVKAWQQAVNPKTAAPYAFLFNNLVNAEEIIKGQLDIESLGIKAINDFTFEIQLKQADSAFLEKLTLPVFYPLTQTKSKNHQIISNGAYTLEKWNIQDKLVLNKNPYYYAKNKVYFDVVNYWVTEDQSSELKRFRAGELDLTESIPDSQITWIKQNLPSQLHINPYLGSFFLGLNTQDKYLKNLDLRRALSLAIDRKILTEKVLKTGQKPAYHIVPRSLVDDSSKTPIISQLERNKQAQAFLIKSGINPKDLKLEILYNNSENQRKLTIAIAAMWRQTLGIRATLFNQEWKVFVQSRKLKIRQAFRSGWIADYADALSFMELFISTSRFNFYHYNNTTYDDLIEKIKEANDPKTKNKLIEQAENKLLHDLPVIPLYYYVSRHLVTTQLMGYVDNVADRHLSKYLYRKEEER